jgi:hypothetical protein
MNLIAGGQNLDHIPHTWWNDTIYETEIKL